jgi:NAD(P)-dependent dehydrogenase (short-subunit alcohol dehydrogenase family)
VTGAASGIGLATVARFASEGAPADRAALRAFLDDGRWEKRFGLARVG